MKHLLTGVNQAFLTLVINSCWWTNLVLQIWVKEARVEDNTPGFQA